MGHVSGMSVACQWHVSVHQTNQSDSPGDSLVKVHTVSQLFNEHKIRPFI